MTTAELIKKRAEGQTNPVQPEVQPVFERQSTTMGDNEGFSTPVENVSEPKSNPVSLYEIGKGIKENASIKPDEVLKSTTLNPIKTPEYEKFRNEVIGANMFGVETEEQKEKRERADFIKQGLTGFTEGLSALANLYYTTKGAPSQKYTSQMPALQERLYRERLERDKKLENFRAWQRAKADKGEEREYNLNLFNIKQEAANKAAEIKYYRDLGLIDAKKAAELEKLKGKAEFDKEMEAVRQDNRVALADINNKAAMDRTKYNKDNTGGGSNSTIRVPIGNDGDYAEYRKNDLTSSLVISDIYNSLPDKYLVRGKEKRWNEETKKMEYPIDKNPSLHNMQAAIGKALSDGYFKEMAPEIQVGGKKNNGKRNEGDNTPPSRREKENKDNDNVPPSRRK